MKQKGFTLVELLATIVIIGLIMTIVLPSALKVSRKNKTRKYEEYEKMMIEYAKVSDLNNLDIIKLNELNELDNVKKECKGYVTIDHSEEQVIYKSYISCDDVYQTEGYDSSLIN